MVTENTLYATNCFIKQTQDNTKNPLEHVIVKIPEKYFLFILDDLYY